MEGNYIQLQQKLQNMKININEINRIVEKKTEMIASLNEQEKEIHKKAVQEQNSLNENIKKKEELEKLLDEVTTSYKQVDDSVSSLLALINNKS